MRNAQSILIIVLSLLIFFTHEPSHGNQVGEPRCVPRCHSNEVCINTFESFGVPLLSKCIQIPREAPDLHFTLPFDSETEVTCTHSSGTGSHSSVNAFFALDLASDYAQPAVIVRASASGQVHLFAGADGQICNEPKGEPSRAQISDCGQSWGNRILLDHGGGIASFYVHLDHFLIGDKAFVKAGDPVGVEGWTGAAGHRHLHWSVQKLQGATPQEWKFAVENGWPGKSIPFHFLASRDGLVQNLEVSNIFCAQGPRGSVPTSQQPKFRGVQDQGGD